MIARTTKAGRVTTHASNRPKADGGCSTHQSDHSNRSLLTQNQLLTRVGSCSETGSYRKQNEDRFAALPESGIVLVADGVGGHYGGARASATVARVLPDWLRFATRCVWPDIDVVEAIVTDAVESARREMIEIADCEPAYYQMATTMVAGVVLGGSLYLTHVGDCRGYLLRADRLMRLTKDHTFVQLAIDAGTLTEETARHHPWRHMITNSVGIKPLERPISIDEFPLKPNDRIMLCSDGLTGVVTDDQLQQVLSSDLLPQATADALVELAIDCDSHDNVTCVVADIAERCV